MRWRPVLAAPPACPVILLTPLLDIAAGAILQAKEPGLRALPGLLIVIPPFVSQAGALGGILSSRLSSKLQLGVLTAKGLPEQPALVDGAIRRLSGAVGRGPGRPAAGQAGAKDQLAIEFAGPAQRSFASAGQGRGAR